MNDFGFDYYDYSCKLLDKNCVGQPKLVAAAEVNRFSHFLSAINTNKYITSCGFPSNVELYLRSLRSYNVKYINKVGVDAKCSIKCVNTAYNKSMAGLFPKEQEWRIELGCGLRPCELEPIVKHLHLFCPSIKNCKIKQL